MVADAGIPAAGPHKIGWATKMHLRGDYRPKQPLLRGLRISFLSLFVENVHYSIEDDAIQQKNLDASIMLCSMLYVISFFLFSAERNNWMTNNPETKTKTSHSVQFELLALSQERATSFFNNMTDVQRDIFTSG